MPVRFENSLFRTLNLSFESEGEKASFLQSLREGQTLQARVVDQAADGRWILRIRGKELMAESRMPLSKGAVVSTRVERLGPPVVLFVLGGDTQQKGALSRALKDLGLEDDPAGRAVLGRMIAKGLSLDGRTVQRLRDGLIQAGINISDAVGVNRTVDAMLLLNSRSVPITSSTLGTAMASPAPQELGVLLGNLLDLIRGLYRGTGSSVDSEMKSFEKTLVDLFVGAEMISGGELRRMVQNLGLGMEGKLRMMTEKPESTGTLQHLFQTDMKAALLRLGAILSDPKHIGGLDAGDAALLETLKGRVGQALGHIEHLQLLNLPARDPDPHLYLQLPVRFGEEGTTVDLRVFYSEQEGQRKIDPENVRLVMRLDLTHLGKVEVDLRIANRIVDCRIDVDDEAQRALFNAGSDDLKAGLEGSGYQVRKLGCEVRPAQSEEGGSEEGGTKIGLDVRA